MSLNSILRDKHVISSIPSCLKTFNPPTVVYSLKPPISSIVLNFNKFVSQPDVDQFLENDSTLPCNCAESPFRDKHHGHIISGDLRLVENNKLRKLLVKGPKYREKRFVNWDEIENSLIDSVKVCAKEWCNKHGENELIMREWVCTVSGKIRNMISLLKNRLNQALLPKL